jgi:formamidopyrimidine-DNA glycosylase
VVVPELPEVETVVRDLRPRLTGRRVASVRASRLALRRPWRAAWGKALTGRTVRAVTRRGKWIVLDFGDDTQLVVHLGMTGQLKAVDANADAEDHTHLVFGLGGGRELRFRDVRRFGSATLFAGPGAMDGFFRASGLGPEPFGLDPRYWRVRMAATGRALKAVLLDQRVVAGVGNIYADEALFEARLHPARAARGLDAASADRLRRAVERVLTRAIGRRGSTIRDYVGGSGLRGEYQNEFRVYGRTGLPCPRCGAPVARVRLAGRSTHFCPACQPAAGDGRDRAPARSPGP